MAIFDKTLEKSDFDKIGVNVIKPYKYQDKWVFDRNNQTYPFAPAGLTDFVLSPVIVGADRLIITACSIKNIKNPENGFNLLFSEAFFPTCDVKLTYKESKFDGNVYKIEGINLQVNENQQAWLCPYLTFYYKKPPQTLYLKVEEL